MPAAAKRHRGAGWLALAQTKRAAHEEYLLVFREPLLWRGRTRQSRRKPVGHLAAIALVCGGLPGCLMPVPPLPYRQEAPASSIPADPAAAFPAGKTRRSDVVRALGAPNAAAEDGSWIVYSDRLSFGKWHLYYLGTRYGDMIPSEGMHETIRYRNLIVAFDAFDRVFEVVTETGECEQTGRASACVDTRDAGDRFTLSVDRGVLQAPHDRVRARFIPAARREDGRWVEGVLVLTDYGLAFVSTPGPAAPHRPMWWLPGIEIRDVGWGPEGASGPCLPTAVLSVQDGRQEVFDLGGRFAPTGAVPMLPYRQLTERFIEAVRALHVRAR
jgi:hypothetical protein